MGKDVLPPIFTILFLILILTIPVYAQLRNLAPENIENQSQGYNLTSLNIPPDRLDTKLLELVNEMQNAINITARYDNKTAEQLANIRDKFIQDTLNGDIRDAQADLQLFNQILMDFISSNVRAGTDIPINELLDTIRRLGDIDLGGVGEYQPINPPEQVTPPRIGNFTISPMTPTPYIPSSAGIGSSFLQIMTYVFIIGGLVALSVFIFYYWDRVRHTLIAIGEKMGIIREPSIEHLSHLDFYRYFLELVKRKGYGKKDYEGPVEHIYRIDNDKIRDLGFKVAYTFEDIKYGYKRVEEDKIKSLIHRIREGFR